MVSPEVPPRQHLLCHLGGPVGASKPLVMLYQAVRQRERPGKRDGMKQSGPCQGPWEVQAPHPGASAELRKEPGRCALMWSLGFSFLMYSRDEFSMSPRSLCVNDLGGELSLNLGLSSCRIRVTLSVSQAGENGVFEES